MDDTARDRRRVGGARALAGAQSHARGPGRRAQHRLKLASGTYVTFMDGDDWLAPGYLSGLVAAIDGLGCDFVRTDHVQVEGRKRVVHRAPEARRGLVLNPRETILPADVRTMVDYPYAWAGIYRRHAG
ncbi:glycosyltransferase [Nonomuraea dietziae]|uniref:glycosyltransferase n=1 Tax=Nonomuraea dietziae TaxID=65515 RepID=UPI0031CE8980